MKFFCRLILLLITLTATMAFSAEVLDCHVGLSHPESRNLVFMGNEGVRLVSEKYDPPQNSSSTAGKSFRLAIEEMGSREFSIVFDTSRPTSEAPLNVAVNVGQFSSDNYLSILQDIRIDVMALPKFENVEYKNWHTSSMFCFKAPIQECYGNFGANLETDIASGKYFNYSIYCRPM